MTTELLRYINLKLSELLPYEYYEWSKKVVYPYWIGEYSETSLTSEDGYREDTLMITGTTKGSVTDLEEGKEILKKAFPELSGYHAVLDSGTHILVFYDTAMIVPTDGNDIKRLQVNLIIKSWKVSE